MIIPKDNLCNSCTNYGCEFQSGIVRTKCAFYMPPHIEPDNCGNYIVMQPTVGAILIPDNATNGDIVQMMFPNGKVIERDEATGYEQMLDDKYSYCSWFDGLWWNAPYQKGDT